MNGYCYFHTQDLILDRIKLLIKELLLGVNIDLNSITHETWLFEDLEFDSLDLVEFIMKCEEEFGITFEDEYFENLDEDFNIGYICKIIREKLNN